MNKPALIYLDMNIFKRSFDDQSSLRVRLETAAIDVIFAETAKGKYEFPWSFVLEYENSLDPSLERRAAASMLAKGALRMVNPAEAIRERAKEFEKSNIKSRDALHLACAESIGCAYFITCDDKFLKKARQLGLSLKVMNPIEFVNLEEHRNGTSKRF